ncbi:MAG: hypothetical protein Q4C13_07350 [Clostridia bacterium]|nr:hypothetical protein [Clostridia bacterium]
MAQDERGLESRCVCPDCLFSCSACMGTRQGPVSGEELRRLMEARRRLCEQEEDGA